MGETIPSQPLQQQLLHKLQQLKHLTSVYDTVENKNLPEQTRQLEILTDALFGLTQSLFDSNESITYFQSELENKYFRYGLANQSILNLLKKNKFVLINKDVELTDIFSLFSLSRMQIESFAIMFYLFFDKGPDGSDDFRYNIYKLHGLQKQYNFKVQSSDSIEQKRQIIKNEIEELIIKIKASDPYIVGSKSKKELLLKPKYAKHISTGDLIEKAGLKSERIINLWNLYSNHAHSEYISDRQFNVIFGENGSAINESMNVLHVNFTLTSRLCLYLKENFRGASNFYNTLPEEAKAYIEIWSRDGSPLPTARY
jgi:hypothetical protein